MGMQVPESAIWSKTGTLTIAKGISLYTPAIGVQSVH